MQGVDPLVRRTRGRVPTFCRWVGVGMKLPHDYGTRDDGRLAEVDHGLSAWSGASHGDLSGDGVQVDPASLFTTLSRIGRQRVVPGLFECVSHRGISHQ